MTNRRTILRPGLTLAELTLVLTIIGLTTLIGLRQLQLYLNRIATRDAIHSAGGTIARARDEAVARHTPVSVRIDTGLATVELLAQGTILSRTPLGTTHGVALWTSRDSITFDVRGLGYGAANLTLIARKGVASDTVVVSRLGRVRY